MNKDLPLPSDETRSDTPLSPAEPEVRELVERIDELAKKATPGPWERDSDTHYDEHAREHYREHFLCADKKTPIATACHVDADSADHDGEGLWEDLQARANLDFVAELVTAWPTLRAALERLFPAAAVREAYEKGLEDAAKICDEQMNHWLGVNDYISRQSKNLGIVIRARSQQREQQPVEHSASAESGGVPEGEATP
jgi:hypothetical protein